MSCAIYSPGYIKQFLIAMTGGGQTILAMPLRSGAYLPGISGHHSSHI